MGGDASDEQRQERVPYRYSGTESPVPLGIDVQHGSADITQVARDIFALTKLNFNACKIADSEPVTVGFSSALGEILVSNPTVAIRSLNSKLWKFWTGRRAATEAHSQLARTHYWHSSRSI